jgi:trimeric autotransporter adhesin
MKRRGGSRTSERQPASRLRATIGLPVIGLMMLGLAASISAASAASAAPRTPGIVTTVAGGIGGPARATTIGIQGQEIAFGVGQLYVSDRLTIRRVALSSDWLTNVAGVGLAGFSPDGTAALRAVLDRAYGFAIDHSGNVVFAETNSNRVRVIPASNGTFYGQAMTAGHVYTIVGTGTRAFSGDSGPALDADLYEPSDVAIDSVGNVLIDDRGNGRIRIIAARAGTFYGQPMVAGDIYTVAGDGTYGFSGDGGTATSAAIRQPMSIAVGQADNIVIADTGNFRVRVVAASTGTFYGQPMTSGDIYTIAGTGSDGFSGDGHPATGAELGSLTGVTVDPAGDVAVSDNSNNRIRLIAARTTVAYSRHITAGDIYTIAGTGTAGFNGNGELATRGELSSPDGLAVDSNGNLAIGDAVDGRVRVVAARTGRFYQQSMKTGHIYTVVGGDVSNGPQAGVAAARAQLPRYMLLLRDPAGDLLFTGDGYQHVWFMPAKSGSHWGQHMLTGHIYIIGGDGKTGFAGNGRRATGAAFSPEGLALDKNGNVMVADTDARRVLVIAARTGRFWGRNMIARHVYVIAGGGSQEDTLGGLAVRAAMNGPLGLAVDRAGNLLVTDAFGNRLLLVAARTGTFYGRHMKAEHLYVVAGNGNAAFAGDGFAAIAASLDGPDGVTVDHAGNVLIADGSNFRIRVVAARTGTFYGQAMTADDIYTIAGDGGVTGPGNGNPAISTGMGIGAIAVDAAGNVLVGDAFHAQVRVVASTTGTFYGQAMTAGDIYGVAGTGAAGFSGDGGPAVDAEFASPGEVIVTPAGDLLIGDSGRIREVTG